jgi:hypothetical protein
LPTMKVRYLPARVSDPDAGARIDCKRFLLRYLSAFRAESLYPREETIAGRGRGYQRRQEFCLTIG